MHYDPNILRTDQPVYGEAAMMAAGAELALTLEKGGVLSGTIIALSGELGAGKTTFCRGFIQACGFSGRIKSPTYTLLEEYPTRSATICHLDLYRLADPSELEFIGFRDLLEAEAVVLVEWSERVPDLQAVISLFVSIAHRDEESRLLSIAVAD